MFLRSALLAGALLSAGVAHAKIHTSEGGLFCKTEAAVKSLYAFHEAFPKSSMVDSVTMINTADPAAGCDISPLIYELGEIVSDVEEDGDTLDVRKVSVLAICSEDGCVPVKKEGFSAFSSIPTL